ncbi:MAG: MlaD family protein [Bacteroidales bacterium]
MKIKREVKIGALVLIVLALTIWGINYLKGINVFSRTNYYFLEFDNIGGLTPSAGVYVSGYKVGNVHKMYFKEDHSGKIIIEISVSRTIRIPKNSIAQIYNNDIMGTKAIRLIFSNDSLFQHEHDTLITDVEIGLMDQLMPLKNKAERVMMSIDSLVRSASMALNPQTIQNFRATMSNVKNISENLSDQNERLNRMFQNFEAISANLKANNPKITHIISNLSDISDSLAKANVQNTVMQTQQAVAQLNEVLDQINQGKGTLGMLASNDSLYRNLESASRNLDLLLRDLKENPKRYVHFSVFGGNRQK